MKGAKLEAADRDLDELLGRVRNHLGFEILENALAAAWNIACRSTVCSADGTAAVAKSAARTTK
jgi:hypothetical protein